MATSKQLRDNQGFFRKIKAESVFHNPCEVRNPGLPWRFKDSRDTTFPFPRKTDGIHGKRCLKRKNHLRSVNYVGVSITLSVWSTEVGKGRQKGKKT